MNRKHGVSPPKRQDVWRSYNFRAGNSRLSTRIEIREQNQTEIRQNAGGGPPRFPTEERGGVALLPRRSCGVVSVLGTMRLTPLREIPPLSSRSPLSSPGASSRPPEVSDLEASRYGAARTLGMPRRPWHRGSVLKPGRQQLRALRRALCPSCPRWARRPLRPLGRLLRTAWARP